MRPITRIRAENFLSLKKLDLNLNSINVLVGPNGSGKTNILKAFEFLGEVSRRELGPAISHLGGFDNLQYRGVDKTSSAIRIELYGQVTRHSSDAAEDEYKLSFWKNRARILGQKPRNIDLVYRNESLKFKRYQGRGRRITLNGGRATVINNEDSSDKKVLDVELGATGLGTLRRLSEQYGSPEWNAFAELVEDLRLFEIDVDRIRRPSVSDNPSRLKPNAENLPHFLLWMSDNHPDTFSRLMEDVSYVLKGFKAFSFVSSGGSSEALSIELIEEGLDGQTPLARASFGTIRSIALFAMLHDPNPPKLTCLEEVDHGLHPHALDRIVDRLREASAKTQFILATHSPALVNRFSVSELIIVERDQSGAASVAARPKAALVRELKQNTGYELGELWFSGVLGGGL